MAKTVGNAAKQTSTGTQGFEEFGIYVHQGYNLIKVCQDLSRESFEAIQTDFESVDARSPQPYLVDFGKRAHVGTYWGRFLMQVKKKIDQEQGSRSIRIINASPGLISSLKAQGLDRAFPLSTSLEAACRDLGIAPKVTFEISVLVPFINTSIVTLQSMAQVKSQKKGGLANPENTDFMGDISASTALECSSFQGVFTLSFPKATILALVTRITGAETSEVTSLVQSAVGEIANVTVTGAKKNLNDTGYGLTVGIPKVVLGTSIPPDLHRGEFKRILIPITSDVGVYFIDIRYLNNVSGN